MTKPDGRDQSLERWLREMAGGQVAPSVECLDAETAAAWADGALSGTALDVAQRHVADCARCQTLMGTLVRVDTAVSAVEPEQEAASTWRRWLAWTIPLGAAAGSALADDASARQSEPGPRAASPPPPPPAPAALASTPPVPADRLATERGNGNRAAEADRASQESPAARRESVGLASATPLPGWETPDGSVRWRLAGGVIQRSSDGGGTWAGPASGAPSVMTAGDSPSASVCWVVGRGGAVYLTTDGGTWQRRALPTTGDLTSVRATDAQAATVTAADGRTFATTDGGLTWTAR